MRPFCVREIEYMRAVDKMKWRLWRLVLLIAVQYPLHLHAQYYNQTIYAPSSKSKALNESVNDMAFWLGKATGKPFRIEPNKAAGNSGIQLQQLDESDLPKDVKNKINEDGQAFYLAIQGTRSVRIIGTGDNSFINGIYTFLQELGFRWYMPGDNWTIIPQLKQQNLSIKKVYRPDFQNRYYFGTGGLAPIAGLDPQNTFKADFDLWNRRNRFSSDFAIKGHMGQAFFNANKKVLTDHPEYSCNGNVNPNGRIDIANPNAVNLYVQWALDQVNPQTRFPVIGVDPADNSGSNDDCLPAGMPQIKSWSDKYFWLANRVAQAAEEKGMAALVELYAYSSHAAPPSFDLHKNVYPVIIPYAFQRVASPEDFISLWRKKIKGRSMGLYDYWNITQWSSDVPQFDIFSIAGKLKFWKENNVTTINLETTTAKGPMGHAFWLASQMMWNTRLSFDSLYNAFLIQCFGTAAPDIKKMYDRWSLHYQGAMDVSLSLHDLASASAKTTDADVQKRITELKAYVHYLKLYYDYQHDASPARYQELVNHIYGIHHLRLLQTSALITRYIKAPTGFTQAIEKNAVPVEVAQIEKKFKKDIEENPVAYTISSFNLDITRAYPVETGKQQRYNPGSIDGSNTYSFYLPKQQQFILRAGSTKDAKLLIKDDKGKTWYDKVVSAKEQGYDSIAIDLPKGKYVLSFGAYYQLSRMIFPENIVFFSSTKNYSNAGYPLLYTYVPKGVTEIIYKDAHGPGMNKRGDWIDPDGKHVKPELIKYATYRIPVRTEYSGKVWALNIGHRSFQILNIPEIFSLNAFQYTE